MGTSIYRECRISGYPLYMQFFTIRFLIFAIGHVIGFYQARVKGCCGSGYPGLSWTNVYSQTYDTYRLSRDTHMLRVVVYGLSSLPPISTTIVDLDLLDVLTLGHLVTPRPNLQFMLTANVSSVMRNLLHVFVRTRQHARRLTTHPHFRDACD